MQTPKKEDTPEQKRGPKPKVSSFESNEKEAPDDQMESSATLKSKDAASIDLLMKISPKTRKSTTRSAKKSCQISRPATRGQTAAAEKNITPFENIKTPKKLNLAKRSLKSEQIVSSQLRSTATKRSYRNRSEASSESVDSDLSLSNMEKAMAKGSKLRKKSKVEKLFMTEKKTPSVGKVSSDPLVKKYSGGSENLEKALDDMLSCTPKAPVLRSEYSKKEKDTMPPPKERKSKLKRKKRLEKMLEAK